MIIQGVVRVLFMRRHTVCPLVSPVHSTSNLRHVGEEGEMLTEEQNSSLKTCLHAPWHCTDHVLLPKCPMYLPLLLLERLYVLLDQATYCCLVLMAEPACLLGDGRDSYSIPVIKMDKCLGEPPRQVANVQKKQVSSINQT